MKQFFLLTLFLGIAFLPLTAQSNQNSVLKIYAYKNLCKYQNFYLLGQPSIEALTWMKEQGVNKIINLRSEDENNQFVNFTYNECDKAKGMGFAYYSIPVKGKNGFTPQKLAKMDSPILEDDVALIHCAGAGRVHHFFMAYLIKSRGYSIDDAIKVGKQFGYYMPLELLLEKDLKFSMKNN